MSDLLKDKPFRSMLPYHILLDLDLNAQHLRLYGIIEQMESCPQTTPYFSYTWIAEQLGIQNRRGAIKVANKLKEKGYIKRTINYKGDHVWSTAKQEVVVSPQDTNELPSVPAGHPPSVPAGHPKSLEVKSQNKNNIYKGDKEIVDNSAQPFTLENFVNQERKQIKQTNSIDTDITTALTSTECGVDSQLVRDWLEIRRIKGAPNTLSFFHDLLVQLGNADKKHGMSPTDCLKLMVNNGWSNLVSDKIMNKKSSAAKNELDIYDTSWGDEDFWGNKL